MNLAFRIPETDPCDWLRLVAETKHFRQVEVAAATLAVTPGFNALARHLGISILSIPDLLPRELALYWLEAAGSPAARTAMGGLLAPLRGLPAGSIHHAGLQLGMEGLDMQNCEEGLRLRLDLVQRLLAATVEDEVFLCLWARYPREFPGCRQWDLSNRLILEVRQPRCRLAVHLAAGQLPADFVPGAFVRETFMQSALLRFYYEPYRGENLEPALLAEFATALRRHAFHGGIIFAPLLPAAAAEADGAKILAGLDAAAARFLPPA